MLDGEQPDEELMSVSLISFMSRVEAADAMFLAEGLFSSMVVP